MDASGNVFVADTRNNAIKKIVAVSGVVSSSSTVVTVGSGFFRPGGVAVDLSGNVFVADTRNNAIKQIVAVGGAVSSSSTVNTISSGFNYPYGVALDSFGNVFVADTNNNAVKEIVAVGGVVSSGSTVETIGGGFYYPLGVVVDSRGNIFIADTSNGAAKQILTQSVNFGSLPVATNTPTILSPTFTFDTGGIIGAPTVVTQGAPGLDLTDAGTGSCTTNGTSYVYSAGDSCTVDVTFTPRLPGVRLGAVRLIDNSAVPIATALLYGTGVAGQISMTPGTISTIAGSGSYTPGSYGGPALIAGLGNPVGLRVDARGDVYLVDAAASWILKIDASSQGISSIAGMGTAGFAGDGGPATASHLSIPFDLAFDGAGNLYLADTDNHRIRKIDGATGIITTIAGTGVNTNTGDGGPRSPRA